MKNVNQIYKNSLPEGEITQEDHINAMWKALKEGCDSYHTLDNGEGIVHVFSFLASNRPGFITISNDTYNQIQINLLPTSVII